MEGALTLSRDYSLKPALLAGRRVYRVEDGALTCRRSDDAVEWRVALSEVSRAAFVEHLARGLRLWRFDLTTGKTRRTISLNLSESAGADDPDRAEFLELLDTLCRALARVRPGLQADIGEYGRYRLIWFALGVLSVLSGGGILGAAVLTGVSVDRLVTAGVGLGVLILLGLVLIRSYHPWSTPPSVPVETLVSVLRARLPAQAVAPT